MTISNPGPYARQDALTDPGVLSALYDDLPVDPSALREVVSQLITHVDWAARYGIPPNTAMPRDTQPVADRLKLIQSIRAGSLAAQRPPDKRTFGTCRDYSLMMCSMLRHSIPARVRCGFATYFPWRPYEDHWICEYWSREQTRWILALMRSSTSFSGINLRSNSTALTFREKLFFQPGRRGCSPGPEPFRHPISDMAIQAMAIRADFGFLRVNLHRDLLSLTNQQMSAWDNWRDTTVTGKTVSDAEAARHDQLADAIEAAGSAADGLEQLRELAEGRRVPPRRG